MSEQLPYWLTAPEDIKKESFSVHKQAAAKATEGKDPREHIDWRPVNDEMAQWWKEKGYHFP